MSTARPTHKDTLVLAKLDALGEASPTEIGLALGKPHSQASSFVATSLRRLVDADLVRRIEIDRAVRYRAMSEDGRRIASLIARRTVR